MAAESMGIDAILERVGTGMSTEKDAHALRQLMATQQTMLTAALTIIDNGPRVRRMFSPELRRQMADLLTADLESN